MSNVMVQRIKERNAVRPLLPETIDLLEGVRRRAYELFQRRGGIPGSEITDWLQAENEIFQVPRMDLAETDREYQLNLAVPGYEAKDLRVAALPDSVIVEGEVPHQHRGIKGNVRICEFGERKVYRQIRLPEPVDVDHVSATLDKGLLEIRATKANHGARATAA